MAPPVAVATDTDRGLARLIGRLKAAMRAGARNGRLQEALDKGLGLDARNEAAQQILEAWGKEARQQVTWALPTVIILPATAMGNAQGGYWAEGKVIYISAGLLKTASPKRQLEVITEELFHYYDDLANNSDSPGDEGEKAAQLLLGQKPSESAWAANAIENDRMEIDNGSRRIWVEAATVTTSSYAGTTSADSITGTTGNDTLAGNSGNDTFQGLAGNDSLRGEAGNDLIYGGEGSDTLRGGAGADTLLGDGGNDILFADSASFYSASADSLLGGLGNDTYYIDNTDNITEGTDAGFDHVAYQVSAVSRTIFRTLSNIEVHVAMNALATRAVNISSTTNASTIFGGLGADSLTGSIYNDVLDQGKGGNDTLVGGAGRDIYQIQFAPVKIVETAQDKTALVDDANWDIVFWLNTSSGTSYAMPKEVDEASLDPLLTTTGGITGNEWNNILRGNKGINTLSGGGGDDTIFGGDTNQTDKIDTGIGNDMVVYTNMDQLTPQPSKVGADVISAMNYKEEDRFAFQNFYFEGQRLDAITGFVFSIAVVNGPLTENTATTWNTAISNAQKGQYQRTDWGTVTTAPVLFTTENSIALNRGISLVYSRETRILKYYTNDDYTYGSAKNPGAAVANLSQLDATAVLETLDGTDFMFITGFLRPTPIVRPTF